MPGFASDLDDRHRSFGRNAAHFAPDEFIQHQIAEDDQAATGELRENVQGTLTIHRSSELQPRMNTNEHESLFINLIRLRSTAPASCRFVFIRGELSFSWKLQETKRDEPFPIRPQVWKLRNRGRLISQQASITETTG
jgi:hypothetical protein